MKNLYINSIFNKLSIDIKEKIDNIIIKEYNSLKINYKKNNSFIKECICCNSNNIYIVKSFKIKIRERNKIRDGNNKCYYGHYEFPEEYIENIFINLCYNCYLTQNHINESNGRDIYEALDIF